MKKISTVMLFLISIGLFGASVQAQEIVPTSISASTTNGPFPDVTVNDVNNQAITFLKSSGVISGYPDGTYKPDNEINRAEFTKIIVGSLYKDLNGKNCFPDVHDEWYAPYICKAKELKIVEGYPDGNFKPAENINFAEASKIIANANNLQLGQSGQSWFKPYVSALQAKNDIPLSVEFFDEKVTRDEMAEMIYRLKANDTSKASRTFDEITGDDFVKGLTCAQIKSRYIEQSMYQNDNDGRYYLLEESAVSDAAKEAAPPSAAPGAGAAEGGAMDSSGSASEFSTTNLQVAGVDEADVIKNDGRYIYIIKGDTVRIVDAYPPENLKEIVSFTLGDTTESYYPYDLFVDGTKLVVIGSMSRAMPYAKLAGTSMMPYFGSSRTKAYIVDISDRSSPKVTRSVEFDGGYTSSRRVGDTLYLIMNQNLYYPYLYGYYNNEMAKQEPADMFVPKMLDSKYGKEHLTVSCGDIYLLPKSPNFNFLITAAIPLNDMTKEVTRSVIVGSPENIYSSPNNLYIAATDWGGGFYRPYADYGTAIYRYTLKNGGIAFEASGKVPGTIINQFSMDEKDSYFRIATTKEDYSLDSTTSNNLYVLNSAMDVVGKIENIAPGEKIFSTRFTGNTAYMVTFKRVDPFFVIDLTNPRDPKIKGELKIPGYSNYLQPYDDTHVIGFGNDVDENDPRNTADFVYYTAIKGIKVSLFDITDITKPVEMYKEIIGDRGTYSEVLYNHKALLFDKEKGLLAFPITVYEMNDTAQCSSYKYSTCPTACQKMCVPTSCTSENGITVCSSDCDGAASCVSPDFTYGKPVFDGAYVYNLSLKYGFQLKGKITHYNATDTADLEKNGYTNYEKTIQRIIYIGEYLYSISPAAIKANVISDLAEKKVIELAGTIWNIKY